MNNKKEYSGQFFGRTSSSCEKKEKIIFFYRTLAFRSTDHRIHQEVQIFMQNFCNTVFIFKGLLFIVFNDCLFL